MSEARRGWLHWLIGFALPAVVLLDHAWGLRAFTIDDAYISYRYARNLVNGAGLVYNLGEPIEGYTNFLFTLLLALGTQLGIDPNLAAKGMGTIAAVGSLYAVYRLADRLSPYQAMPCVATWLLATSMLFSGYAVFGLETTLFSFLVLAGTWALFDEEELERRIPWSGAVFALAGLTRPEAPAFLGILMIFLGRRFASRRNLLRAALFAVPVGIHLIWRHAYYGSWLPNTFSAKTGDLGVQLAMGWTYVRGYVEATGVITWFAAFGLAIGVVARRWEVMAVGALAGFVAVYTIAVGGDWMPFYRFLAPFEPFAFLLADLGVRAVADRRDNAATLVIAPFLVAVFWGRVERFRIEADYVHSQVRFWDEAAGGTARWFEKHNAPRGVIALTDIGEIGYRTDFPILDLLGLVDPVISRLPGGYTHKVGSGFTDRFFAVMPEYTVIISSTPDCLQPSIPSSQTVLGDPRFLEAYAVQGRIPVDGGYTWCIYERR